MLYFSMTRKAGTNMKKFEYMRLTADRFTVRAGNSQYLILVNKFNELGAKGWELVTFSYVNGKLACAYFKRELKAKKKKTLPVINPC